MRKPCFECNESEQDDMRIGECLESPLCTASLPASTCRYLQQGRHWEDCGFGARSEEYPAFLAKQNMTQCPCCKGSGFIPKKESIVDEIRALEWYHSWCPICQNIETHGHATGCEFAAILRRLK